MMQEMCAVTAFPKLGTSSEIWPVEVQAEFQNLLKMKEINKARDGRMSLRRQAIPRDFVNSFMQISTASASQGLRYRPCPVLAALDASVLPCAPAGRFRTRAAV